MSEQKRMGRDLTVGSVPKLLIAFASPLFLSNLLQAVYNMVDMIVVGKYVGSTGLSAVSIGGDILHFITFIAMGFANAGQVIISQYTGAGRKDKINRCWASAIWASGREASWPALCPLSSAECILFRASGRKKAGL